MIRREITELEEMGAFPASQCVDLSVIRKQQKLLHQITPPVSDAEATRLVKLLGVDDYFGLAWTIVHLIEEAPNWPLMDSLQGIPNEWISRLRSRVARKNV